MDSTPILQVDGLSLRYGGVHAVQGVKFAVRRGTCFAILGRNGAGKTTTLRALMSLGPKPEGEIQFDGRPTVGWKSYEIARAGVAFVPETRGIFPSLTVRENLVLAARPGNVAADERWTLDRAFDLFPRLRERLDNGGGQLSGGEQQMLSIARALLTNPKLLLLDEPTEGLAPVVVQQLRDALARVKQTGLTIVLVEQNLQVALSLADEMIVLGKGLVRWGGHRDEFESATDVRDTWLSI